MLLNNSLDSKKSPPAALLLLSVALTFVVVKMAMFFWYRLTG
jgi:hypothetical protein